MIDQHTFTSVFDTIADTPEQAAHLQARAELMQQIDEWYHSAENKRPAQGQTV